MNQEKGLLAEAWQIVMLNKRYIFWLWLLNFLLARFGASTVRGNLQPVLDGSSEADKLLHGFNMVTFIELLSRPEIGTVNAMRVPAALFGLLFVCAMVFLMPGILRQYTSGFRVSREEFWRTCGRNLWRFVRLGLWYALFAVPIAGIFFGIRGGLTSAAEKSTNEVLPFYLGTAMLLVIFLVMTIVRVWFDLAEVDIVVRDQNAVRKSVRSGFRYTWRFLGKLLGAYLATSVIALITLLGGIWLWHVLVAPASVFGAILIVQLMMVLWLCMRLWQHAIASAFYLREMLVAPGYSRPVTTDRGTLPVPTPSPAGVVY